MGALAKAYSLISNVGLFTFTLFLFLSLSSVTYTSCPFSSTFCFLGVLVVSSSSVSMASEKYLLLVFSEQLDIGVIFFAARTNIEVPGCSEMTSFTEEVEYYCI